jgi:hypothetical protein
VRSHSFARCVAAASLAGGSLSAAAHVVTTGFGAVADGIGHFAVSPEDLIPARYARGVSGCAARIMRAA